MNNPESACTHRFAIAVWRCLRERSESFRRLAEGLNENWAMTCPECHLFDFLPAEGTIILTSNRRTGKLEERDPR